ncbi:MAG: ParB/RepB/Spo0J family partition protein [Roseovarius sp.]|nr:ParB/RepB/Spo0J family partition protein [Roseovarius sp.]
MTNKTTKQRGLGRGLSALMADVGDAEATDTESAKAADTIIPIEKIFPNPEQPRRQFDADQLEDLSASIKEKGIIQPLIVRPRPGASAEFEIVAGERRWRAAQMAKLHEIPVLIREFDDVEVLEIAIIENIQRTDLNPVEEATGYKQLMDKFGHTQDKMAEALGKSRSHIANAVRLLNLPDEVKGYLSDNKLSAGHARALITADDSVALARKVIKQGLTVRETEKLAKAEVGETTGQPNRHGKPQAVEKDADTKALEGDLAANLGMKVSINHKPGQEKGQVTISYDSFDELDALCRRLSST